MKRCSEKAAVAVQWGCDKEIPTAAQAGSGGFGFFFPENSSDEEFPTVTNII